MKRLFCSVIMMVTPIIACSSMASRTTAISQQVGTESEPLGGGGGKIAFESHRDGNGEIYVMNVDGSDQVNITNYEASDNSPAWSPDGTKIAFISSRDDDGDFHLYVMDADGSNVEKLSDLVVDPTGVAWSPDGTRIVFVALLAEYGVERDTELVILDLETGMHTYLGRKTDEAEYPLWSPDGSQIAYVGFHRNPIQFGVPLLIQPDGSGPIRLAVMDEVLTKPAGWSADSTHAMFGGHAYHEEENRLQTVLISIEARNIIPISGLDAEARVDAWSPDRHYVLFTWAQVALDDIYVKALRSNEIIRLTEQTGGDNHDPVWQP